MLKELMAKIESEDLTKLEIPELEDLNREFAEGQKYLRDYRIKINEERDRKLAKEHAQRTLMNKTDEQKRALLQELTAEKVIPTEEEVKPAE